MSFKHPLADIEIQCRNFKCFGESGSGFFSFSPVSLIIGKNNSGKSTIVDVLESCAESNTAPLFSPTKIRSSGPASVDMWIPLQGHELGRTFSPHRSGDEIPGNHGQFSRDHLVGKRALVNYKTGNESVITNIEDFEESMEHLIGKIQLKLRNCVAYPFAKKKLLRVSADRSVVPEKNSTPDPQPNGSGITNLIRYFINSDAQPRDKVEIDLLKDLNHIYAGDNTFTSITCQENDATHSWEIFLRETEKGDIRLSESGSSLQSVFIILSFLLLVPIISEIRFNNLVLAIEEPENNLHPALLRRLADYLARKREDLGFSLILTTHSPIYIDWASSRDDSCVIHVTRNENESKCAKVLDYDGKTNILDDLDVRGSDILQSNGVIWIEGPSDRIYLRRWLDIISSGKLVEGTHYTFMYYGGRVLAHFEAVPESDQSELISIVSLNRNSAILIDSDRKMTAGTTRKPKKRINSTKRRLIEEIEERNGFSWVTAGKEVENYVPESVWKRVISDDVNIESEFVDIPKLELVKSFKSAKVALAHEVSKSIEIRDIRSHLDLEMRLLELVSHIKRWNALS